MADEKSDKPWVVRDVPELTRRKVKAYAAEQGVTMAQAITRLVMQGLSERPGAMSEQDAEEFTGVPTWYRELSLRRPAIARLVRMFADRSDMSLQEALEDLLAQATLPLRSNAAEEEPEILSGEIISDEITPRSESKKK